MSLHLSDLLNDLRAAELTAAYHHRALAGEEAAVARLRAQIAAALRTAGTSVTHDGQVWHVDACGALRHEPCQPAVRLALPPTPRAVPAGPLALVGTGGHVPGPRTYSGALGAGRRPVPDTEPPPFLATDSVPAAASRALDAALIADDDGDEAEREAERLYAEAEYARADLADD